MIESLLRLTGRIFIYRLAVDALEQFAVEILLARLIGHDNAADLLLRIEGNVRRTSLRIAAVAIGIGSVGQAPDAVAIPYVLCITEI